jgi:hypothetical protein
MPVTRYLPPGSGYAAALRAAGSQYIDKTLLGLVLHYVPETCAATTAPCVLAPPQEAELLARVSAHLSDVAHDPLIAGFYVLDDYPGNIGPILGRVHDLVAAANASAVIPRPTVCGFWASLDAWNVAGQRVQMGAGAFNRALVNYSPSACDAVSVYSYGYAYGAANRGFDWSMGNLLGYVKGALASKGWTPDQPFIGTPAAFGIAAKGFTAPTPDQLRAETAAFCAAGATAIMPYTWRLPAGNGTQDLADDASLRAGVGAGLADCRHIWGAG